MKKHSLLLVLPVLFSVFANAQIKPGSPELKPLTENELLRLASITAYTAIQSDQSSTLPYAVDNSTQPYFRPLFNQSGLECGQASSIGMNFTYEINWARNLPGNITQNQYATHFAYDFINGGSDAGVSYFESWEIVKRCGNPTVAEYGGLSAGGASRWMTGYDKYYNAMHNRIIDVYSISAGDETGLNVLKNWIYNHSNTSDVGGLANIYIQYKTPDAQLAAGTPEAGKWVITTWGGSPNHAVTLVGYNDSIRYDYNNDGQYTNNIDINGDGIVNVKDWEIGGFRLANTYGGINNWGNLGFSYVMYKTFADNLGSGGIWNHAAHIVKVKQDVSPKLTFKITLKHTSRNKLKVIAGVSQNALATEPDHILNLPVFDMQGGDKYMLGGTTEADKTIEFGLDATPLLSEIEPGQQAKFFLLLSETDPLAAATGEIISFALVDYNGATTTIPCTSSNVPIVENGLTSLSIIHTPNHARPVITNTSLPEAKIYEPYSQQMNASGGTPSYRWKFLCDYSEAAQTATFPSVTAQQLAVSNTSSGFAEVTLPFEFPYYGKKYSKLYAHTDGYLMFKPDLMPWTFIIYEKTFFKNTPNISPYMSKPLCLYPAEGDGIWYEGNQNYAIFRWKSSMYGSGPTTDLNFAAKLFPDGKIEFYYGSVVSNDWVTWNAGISNGDGVNYKFCMITDSLVQPAAGSKFQFTTPSFPTEMTLSDDGVFAGTPASPYTNVPIKFYTEDNNSIYNTKTLSFSTKGINIVYTVNSGGDSIVEYGETALLTAKLTNIGSSALHNVTLKLAVPDTYITMNDSIQIVGLINPGQTITIPDALSFSISDQVPDGHQIITTSQAIATEDVFTRIIPITAFSANLKISALSVLDGNNNILMPGESGTLHITLKNEGGSKAVNINALLSAIDPFISVLQGTASIDTLLKDATHSFDIQVSVSPSCPVGHIALALLHLSADKNYAATDSVYFTVGVVAEDFETGNLTRYPWHSGGNASWLVNNNQPYEGGFAANSPALADNQWSSMYVTMNVLCASEISFYRKVSSELNYDFLTFYIDGVEKAKWSGEVQWGKVTYAVTAGQHTFSWKYSKDVNTVSGSDKAWVDYIVWPPYSDLLLVANAGSDGYVCNPSAYQLQAIAINASYLFWSTSGDGYFNNTNAVDAQYHAGNSDLSTGSVNLVLHAGNAQVQIISDTLKLDVFQAPLAMAGSDAAICAGTLYSIQGATAMNLPVLWTTSGDGTFNNNYIISPVYTPGPADITNGQVHLILTAFGSTQCGNDTDSLLLILHPEVISDAGADQSIPYGTSTQLIGQASGGSSPLLINWTPADKLVNAGLINPYTIDLTNSVEFTLHVIDTTTQCSSNDIVFINVTGSPLSVGVSAEPGNICQTQSSQLNAFAGGGTGNYSYSWTSVPVGFTSSISDPVVSPSVTTQYTVEVTDGVNFVQSATTVFVDSLSSAPGQPSGPGLVNVVITPSSNYNVAAVPNTNEYSWRIVPLDAGTLLSSGNSCTVNWNPLFDGMASLSVAGINPCGTGEFSEVLHIIASPMLNINAASNPDRFLVWPNPAYDKICVKTVGGFSGLISILSAKGTLVLQQHAVLNQVTLIDVSKLSSGIYLIEITNESGKLVSKIIISR